MLSSLADITSLLQDTGLIAQAEKLRDEKLAAERKLAAAELRKLDAAEAKEMPVLRGKIERAKAEADAARLAHEQAQRSWHRACVERDGASHRFQQRRFALEATMQQTADPIIAEAIEDLERQFQSKRNNGGLVEHQHFRFPLQSQFADHIATNQDSIGRHLRGIRAAIDQLRRLHLVETSDAEAEVQKIIAVIPPIGGPELPARARAA